MTAITMTVADFIGMQLEACGKTQAEVARDAGFDKPNVITMIKQGKTKLPLAKIGPMASALGLDSLLLTKLVMREYHPEMWDTFEKAFAQPVLSENELEIVLALRAAGLPASRIPASDRGTIARAVQAVIPKS